MMLLRLSGHSGAGKSRLTAALPKYGISCPRAILYTSRQAREGEVHGRDYYFLSRGAIAVLPKNDFLVGPVRDMLQAADLSQLEADLKANNLVLVEIFHGLWPELEIRIRERLGDRLRTASVFVTAVDPDLLRKMPDDKTRAEYIQGEVVKILRWRNKDTPNKIQSRARSAVDEILSAMGPDGINLYDKMFYSAPEGPDGQDEWTRESQPIGRAKQVLMEFIEFVKSVEHSNADIGK